MSISRIFSRVASAFVFAAAAAVAPGQDGGDPAGKAVVLELGRYAFVTEAQWGYLMRSVDAAEAGGAAVLVLRIDCPGGFASRAADFADRVSRLEIPSVAFVEGRAAGAGAFAALACEAVYLAPDAEIGGEAEAIEWRGPGEELPERRAELRYWDVESELQGCLEGRGVGAGVVAALCSQSAEVRVDGRLYVREGDVLTVDLAAGQELGLVDGEAGDVSAAITGAGHGAGVVEFAAPDDLILRADRAAADREGGGEDLPLEQGGSAGAGDGSAGSVADDAAPIRLANREMAAGATGKYRDKIVVIPVGMESLLRETKFDFIRRVIAEAEADGAEAIIFDLDTPGGVGWYTEDVMLKSLPNLSVPTYSFVNTKAVSAGALLAIATDHIYMHPPSTMGSAAPILSSGGDIPETLYKKVIEDMDKTADAAARLKGHNTDIVRAFIRSEAEVEIRAPVVSEDGALGEVDVLINDSEDLLSINDAEAMEIVDGERVFAEGTALSIEDLVAKVGLKGEIMRAKPLGFEAIADWFVKVSPLLLLLAIAGGYLEMNSPGFGVPGILALICLGLFFFGHKVAGFMAGYEVLGVLILGVALLAVEVFVFPGLLVFGILGLVCIFGSLTYMMVDPLDLGATGTISWGNVGAALTRPALNLVIALIGAAVAILFALRYLPSTPLMRWLVLDTGLERGTSIDHPSAEGAGVAERDWVGAEGVAETDLRPAGVARIGGERRDVFTTGEFVSRGAPVVVVEQHAGRWVVEANGGAER